MTGTAKYAEVSRENSNCSNTRFSVHILRKENSHRTGIKNITRYILNITSLNCADVSYKSFLFTENGGQANAPHVHIIL